MQGTTQRQEMWVRWSFLPLELFWIFALYGRAFLTPSKTVVFHLSRSGVTAPRAKIKSDHLKWESPDGLFLVSCSFRGRSYSCRVTIWGLDYKYFFFSAMPRPVHPSNWIDDLKRTWIRAWIDEGRLHSSETSSKLWPPPTIDQNK